MIYNAIVTQGDGNYSDCCLPQLRWFSTPQLLFNIFMKMSHCLKDYSTMELTIQ